MTCPPCLRTISLCLILAASAPSGWADYKDDIGLTALLTELGANAPTGAGISISQVEGVDPAPHYSPDAADSQLSGKSFTYKSGVTGGSSGHATLVAQLMYGTNCGVAPGVTQIDAYEVGGWLGGDYLRFGTSSTPNVESRRLQNHSWVLNTVFTQSEFTEMLRRLDYAIEEDGFLALVGVDNGSGNPVPALLSHSYNTLSVGITTGNHSFGTTTFDEAGRIKPEIVAPFPTCPNTDYGTSYSCAMVSGVAALLLETADGSSGLVNAQNNSEVIKAIMLAGATKSLPGGWSRTPTQPLDLKWGAGLVNVQNSYHLLVAGEHAPSGSTTVSNRGWDFASTTASPARYFFDVPAGHALTNYSVILTWNRQVSDGQGGPSFGNLQVDVADMDLRLYTASGFTLGTELDSSVSTVDNIEHIYMWLGPGRYALEVDSDTTGANYALAWGGTLQAGITTSADPATWGSVGPSSGYYTVGTAASFTATPEPYFLFDQWSGDLSGTTNPVPFTVSSNMTVTAHFLEQLTTNHPTPYWWLAQYDYTSNQEMIVTNIDANGYPLWQSYIAGLVPTNPASQLLFTSQTLLNETNLVLTWDTVTGRVYTVWNGTNAAGNFNPVPGAMDLPATIQSFTNPIPPGSPQEFFLLEVEKP